jgi:UPF0716 family protein affecting phage T7 exclusion
MKTTFKKYLWLWEFIGVALIIVVGIIAKFVAGALLAIVGSTFAVIGLLRVIPLVKTTRDKMLKWIYLFEIITNVVIGVVLVYLGIQNKQMDNIFGWLIGGVLYARGVIYFFATTVRHEESDKPKYIAHIIFITVGAMIIARGGFSEDYLGWIVFALSIISGAFIAYSGFNNYRSYRNNLVAHEITKKVKKADIAPTADEIQVPVETPVKKSEDQLNA